MFWDKENYFSIASGQLREDAIRLHHQRYEEVGFFKQGEHDPYPNKSTYFVAQSLHGEVVGVTRLIHERIDQLPTIKNFNIYDLDQARLSQLDLGSFVEVSAFTKLPAHDVGIGLLKSIWQYSIQNGITHWVCCIDDRVYKYMQRMFFSPFKAIGVSQVYLGSTTIPCAMSLAECAAGVKKNRPALYNYFYDFTNQQYEVAGR